MIIVTIRLKIKKKIIENKEIVNNNEILKKTTKDKKM